MELHDRPATDDGRDRRLASGLATPLEGTWRSERLFALRQAVELLDVYQQQIVACDREIEGCLRRLRRPDRCPGSSIVCHAAPPVTSVRPHSTPASPLTTRLSSARRVPRPGARRSTPSLARAARGRGRGGRRVGRPRRRLGRGGRPQARPLRAERATGAPPPLPRLGLPRPVQEPADLPPLRRRRHRVWRSATRATPSSSSSSSS